jgi:rfaE bifunctional protein kinase chain/domain
VRCVVVGDLMLDRYVTGTVDRISPEAPVPVVRVEAESSAVGGAANVAHNVVALGGACAVVGIAGKDEGGKALKRELEALGVSTRGLVETDQRPTTVKTRVLARHHQVVRFDHEVDGDVPPDVAARLVAAVKELARDADVLVIEDFTRQFGVTYTILNDPDMIAMERYAIVGLPTTLLMDTLGIIRYVTIGAASPRDPGFEGTIQALLKR